MKDLLQIHKEKTDKIQKYFNKNKKYSHSFTISKNSQVSNTVRENAYRRKGAKIPLQELTSILSIDPEQKIVIVEPQVTMEQLVDYTLQYNLIPPVVPEFKGITVGGAIMGAALESSSHKYGQFNDSCIRYEILLGDGTVIFASANENPDLFYGISGSYGSFGILLSVWTQLTDASKWVELDCTRFSTLSLALESMQRVHSDSVVKKPFVEAIVYQKNDIAMITGSWWKNDEDPPKNSRFPSHFFSPLYYQAIKDLGGKELHKRFMKVKDYLFRHDRGAFWVGSYLLHGSLFLRFLLDWIHCTPNLLKRWNSKHEKCYHKQKYPGKIFRSLFGLGLSSQFLYKILHRGNEKWFSKNFVIQDFYIPEENTSQFVEAVLENTNISPLWLCPISPTNTPQFLSPHFKKDYLGVLFDIGVYGFSIQGSSVTKDLEQLVKKMNGRKMLYGDSYYSEEDFWQIYSYGSYNTLRKKYFAENCWLNLTEKIF